MNIYFKDRIYYLCQPGQCTMWPMEGLEGKSAEDRPVILPAYTGILPSCTEILNHLFLCHQRLGSIVNVFLKGVTDLH